MTTSKMTPENSIDYQHDTADHLSTYKGDSPLVELLTLKRVDPLGKVLYTYFQ